MLPLANRAQTSSICSHSAWSPPGRPGKNQRTGQPLIWPIQPFHCRSARASHGAHALLMAVHEVVGTQHAPARARLRLAAVLVARTTSCWSVCAMGRSGRATVRPPCSS